ncbi:MAG: glycosyltransferase family 4 protein [Acidobacteriota bacterium]
MRVAVYTHYFTPEIGAPSARLHEMGRAWVANGNSVEVITCFPNHPDGKLYPGYKTALYSAENIDGMNVHRHWTYITPNRGFLKKTLGHISYLPSAILLSGPRVRPADAYIGSSPTFFAAMAAAFAAAVHRAPFIMEVRDLWPAIFIELGVLKNRRMIAALEHLELWLYKRATRVVTVTDSFRTNLIERGVPAEKVVTITNGADTEFWREQPQSVIRGQAGLEDKFIVLYIGAHGISQGLQSVLDAAGQLRDKKDIVFLFVGEGAVKEQLMKRAADDGLENVRFLPPVEKEAVRDFYTACDVAIVPLRNIPLFETFLPSKIFEIMSMSRPQIGAFAGEAAAILRASGAGIVVPPEDGKAIAESIIQLRNDPELRLRLGSAGREFVCREYSRTALAGRYEEVMADAIRSYSRT